MINQNIYDDVPYIPPSRDPREINAVERLKNLQQNSNNRVYVNDEEIQHHEMEKEISVTERQLEDKIGAPGGLVPLNAEGKIDGKYLSGVSPTSSEAIISAPTSAEFPAQGNPRALYVAQDENEGNGYLYRWCDIDHCYKRPDDSIDEISEVYGGSADSF